MNICFLFCCPRVLESQVMPTMISSASILFSAMHRRWLTPREMLMTQGFPTGDCSHPCCSFSRLSDFPSRNAICKMAGNSMHTNVSGVVILFCLTQISLDPYIVKIFTKYSSDMDPSTGGPVLKRQRLGPKT